MKLREAAERRRHDLLELLTQWNGWIGELDERLEQEAGKRPQVQRLRTHPGVGLLTALATVVVLGPVERFANGRKVASYVGLIPSEHSSGGKQRFGHLTKQGNRLLRWVLVQAAHTAARSPRFANFYQRQQGRHGTGKAVIALARKLAVISYYRWRAVKAQPCPR